MRARAGVRAARKPGTERETDWHLRRCGQLQSACQYSHGIHVSITVGKYSVRESHGESNQRDERVHNWIRDGSRDRVPFSECFVPIVVVAMLSRCRGAKLHASALMLAFGGMRGIPRSEAQRGCRGARVRVRSWSRHGRVGWWSQVGARPVRVYVAGKRHGGLPREPNDWLRNAEARGCVGRGRGARGIR